jgi:hypothetical protein
MERLTFLVCWKNGMEICVPGTKLFEALCYKLEGFGFKTRLGKLIFSIYLILPAAVGPAVYSAFNRN